MVGLFFLYLISVGERLIKNMHRLFEGAVVEPCLLHGDLWSGNISSDKDGNPVILDPACYCMYMTISLSKQELNLYIYKIYLY